ncbi:hypothetical protein Tco_0320416 [Tanacetum coccineum]
MVVVVDVMRRLSHGSGGDGTTVVVALMVATRCDGGEVVAVVLVETNEGDDVVSLLPCSTLLSIITTRFSQSLDLHYGSLDHKVVTRIVKLAILDVTPCATYVSEFSAKPTPLCASSIDDVAFECERANESLDLTLITLPLYLSLLE